MDHFHPCGYAISYHYGRQCFSTFHFFIFTNSGRHFHFTIILTLNVERALHNCPKKRDHLLRISNFNRKFSHFFGNATSPSIPQVSGFSRRATIYLSVKTCEVFLCFEAIVRVRVYYLDFLFSLHYVTGEC